MDAPRGPEHPLPLPALAERDPTAVALTWRGAPITAAILSAAADALALSLRAAGVGRGDRVACLLPDEPEIAALLHGVARLGAVLVPLNPRWTAAELEWPLTHTEPTAIVHAPGLDSLLPARDRARRIVVPPDELLRGPGGRAGESARGGRAGDHSGPGDRDPGGATPDARGHSGHGERPGDDGDARSGHPRRSAASDSPGNGPASGRSDLLRSADVDSAQAIIHTSGTTGRPKGTVLTWGNQLWSAYGSARRLGVRPDDRWLAPLPLHHVGGLAILLRSALYGTVAALPGRVDAAGLSEALDREPITIVSLVPTQLARLVEVRGDRPPPAGLRAVLLGGGPAAPELLERAHALGYPLCPTYGLSEASSQVATCAPGWSPADGLPPAAPPLDGCDVRVTDDSGRALAAGVAGAIEVRGPTVTPGYWRDPVATGAAIAGGWLRTGDLGQLDIRGRLIVFARRDDVIVTGGENVHPAEVEGVLESHPDVAAACVVGLPDPEWGVVVTAAIEAVPGRRPEIERLRAFARSRLAGYKVPRRIEIVEALPRTASGKVRRGEVRRLFGTGDGSAAGPSGH